MLRLRKVNNTKISHNRLEFIICFNLSLDTDWGSVSHGTLICLDCAGKHRSLGVHVSFVRSIRMDSWSRQQVLAVHYVCAYPFVNPIYFRG